VTVSIGSVAPEVELPGDSGQLYKLSDYQGKKIILYFYPKDNTSGCTKEACDFRDHLKAFSGMNMAILAISRDSIKSHENFKAKYDLNFPLLSDIDGRVCSAYGTWVEKSMYGKKYFGIERSTFLIDESGIIRHIWRKVKVEGHAQEILKIVQEM